MADADFYLCHYTAFREQLTGVFCEFHTRDPNVVEVIARNGDKVQIRRPACIYCDVERGVQRELERERGSEVTIEEVRRFADAARKVNTGKRNHGGTLKEYASGGRAGHEDR